MSEQPEESKVRKRWLVRVLNTWPKRLCAGIVILCLLLLVGFWCLKIGLEQSIRQGVLLMGPKITKTDVRLDKVRIDLLHGSIQLENFVIGNPEGYATDSAISVGMIYVNVDLSSVFSQKLVVEQIRIESPQCTFELKKFKSNVSVLLENVNAYFAKNDDKKQAGEKEEKPQAPPTEPEKQSPKRTVQVTDLSITGGKVRVATDWRWVKGKTLTVSLPAVQIKDIGKNEEATWSDVGTRVLKELLNAVNKAVAPILKNIQGSIKSIWDSLFKKGETE